jgi:uncharacterized protein YqgV (UPF0045/DUF77 family)
MPKMRITISPSDKESRAAKGLISTLILLSKEGGVNCQLASPTEATIEGDEGTLLEILDQIDRSRSVQEERGFAIAMEFEKCGNRPFARREMGVLENNPAVQTCSTELPRKAKNDKERLHDMVLERLARHIKG